MADQLFRDLRHAVRSLLRDRGFTATTLATLALCLAANAAIFAVVQAVLLRPLPFPEPERLVTIYNAYPGAGAPQADNGVPDYDDRLRETTASRRSRSIAPAASTIGGDGGGEPERVTSMPATPSFFRILRAPPLPRPAVHRRRGRARATREGAAELRAVAAAVRRPGLGGRPDAASRRRGLHRGRRDAGRLPLRVHDVQLWTPAAFTPEDRADERRHSNSWRMLARLKPGATMRQAQPQIDALNARNLDRFPHFKELLINAGFHTLRRSASTTTWSASRAPRCGCCGRLPASSCSSARSTSRTWCRCAPRRRCARW